MNLTELLVAAMVVLGAAGSSAQIWAASSTKAQSLSQSSESLQASEADRLTLQSLWRETLPPNMDCATAAAAMVKLAAAHRSAEALNRGVVLTADGRGVQIHWTTLNLNRERWITPAGLGLCQSEGSEELTPEASEVDIGSQELAP